MTTENAMPMAQGMVREGSRTSSPSVATNAVAREGEEHQRRRLQDARTGLRRSPAAGRAGPAVPTRRTRRRHPGSRRLPRIRRRRRRPALRAPAATITGAARAVRVTPSRFTPTSTTTTATATGRCHAPGTRYAAAVRPIAAQLAVLPTTKPQPARNPGRIFQAFAPVPVRSARLGIAHAELCGRCGVREGDERGDREADDEARSGGLGGGGPDREHARADHRGEAGRDGVAEPRRRARRSCGAAVVTSGTLADAGGVRVACGWRASWPLGGRPLRGVVQDATDHRIGE